MANYQVKKRPLTWRKAALTTLYWLFPLTCVWGLTKFFFNLVFGRLIAHIVLPALRFKPEEFPFSLENLREQYPQAKWQAEIHKVTTPDGANLSTLEILHDAQKYKPIQQQMFVIFLLTNGAVYQAPGVYSEMIEVAEEQRCNVLSFNYREVLDPKPNKKVWSMADLIEDASAQVQRVLDQGVSPQNIILCGHSLGGGLACLAARDFHQQESKVKLFDKASFSNLTKVVIGFIRRLDGLAILVNAVSGLQHLFGLRKTPFPMACFANYETWFGLVLSWFAYPFVKFILVITNCEIEAASAYHTIPNDSKEYLTVRTDKIVSKYANLHATLKDERLALKYLHKKIERVKQIIADCDAKIKTLSQKALTQETLQACQQELSKIHKALRKALRATYRSGQYAALQGATQSISKHLINAKQVLQQRKQALAGIQRDASVNLAGLNLSISTYAHLSLTCLESAKQLMQARKMDESFVYGIKKSLREHGQGHALKYSEINLKILVNLYHAWRAFIDCNEQFKFKPKYASDTNNAHKAYEHFLNQARVHFKDDLLVQTLLLYFDLKVAEAKYTRAVIHHANKHPEKEQCLRCKEQCERDYKKALEQVSENALRALLDWLELTAVDDMPRAHMALLNQLRNARGQSGLRFFTAFVGRTMTAPSADAQVSVSQSSGLNRV